MRSVSVILNERRGSWSWLLRARLDGARVVFIETRSADECMTALASTPTALVIVEVTSERLQSSLELLRIAADRFPNARIVAVAQRSLQSVELLLRELGAVHVLFSPRELGPLVELIREHARRLPEPAFSVQQVWEELPWSEEASQ